ncbi:MAG TPA: N-acyl homoserine lactonase family protein [Stellaceae bacterium]|nr:N-acyl homoserine lactonase family protein [Stellaceae bacterium]
MSAIEPFDLFAIRYAHHAKRRASENFIGGDLHDEASPLDYFVWVARRSDRVFLVDTGFGEAAARARQRQLLRLPADGVKALGIDPATIEDVIITHLHYDHAGTLDAFPRARFHIQDREMAFATGRCMCHPVMRHAFAAEDVMAMVRHIFAGRVHFHDGDEDLAAGLSVHRIGGHTAGIQCVRVLTRRGWVVLASDTSHLYANMEQGRPFPIVLNVADMLEGHKRLYQLADTARHIVPGHDPLVMRRYRAPGRELEGAVVRLDEGPVGEG